jgi:hypothetical protein
VIPKMQTERPTDDLDVVAEINIRLRRNGAMSVEGTIGDREFALGMLDNAIDAIKRQVPPKGSLLVPSRDVEVPKR